MSTLVWHKIHRTHDDCPGIWSNMATYSCSNLHTKCTYIVGMDGSLEDILAIYPCTSGSYCSKASEVFSFDFELRVDFEAMELQKELQAS